MTEAEWHICTDPQPMLDFLRASGRVTERRLRLFVCASTRLLWEHLQPGVMQEAVEAGERHADGAAWEDECQRLNFLLTALPVEYRKQEGRNWFADQTKEALAAYMGASRCVSHRLGLSKLPHRHMWEMHAEVTGPQQPALLRDIFGDPFSPPPTLSPSLLTWNDGLIVKLAEVAYNERALPSGKLDPQRLAVLADALEEAGCADAGLLAHLRSPGPHVRGCWGVDVVLQWG